MTLIVINLHVALKKVHPEKFRILCPSLHKIKQFSFYIFISYHLLIHNTRWVLILKRTQRNYKTVLYYWFLWKCSKVNMAYLFIRVLKIHVSEFHWFIKIKHFPFKYHTWNQSWCFFYSNVKIIFFSTVKYQLLQ